MRGKFFKRALPIIFILSLIVALILNPARYIQSVYSGFILFATNVLPALFPFFFFSKILTAVGTATILAQITQRPIKKLYNAPSCASYIFIMSLLSGYPIGAKLIADHFENGLITTSQAKSISAFCSTSGPMFIIGTVASLMFKNTLYGYIILLSHYLGAILNGLIYRKKNHTEILFNIPLNANKNLDNILSDAATSSISSLIIVGSYIAIFSMVIDFAYDINLISLICKALGQIGLPIAISEGIFVSLIEITRGLMLLSQTGISKTIIIPLACGLVSFGGLCITLQSISFLAKCKIKASFYLLTKSSQAIISALICLLICLIVL